MEGVRHFQVLVNGQIEFASFPLGPDVSHVFCRYDVVTGPDWELAAGVTAGITQCSTPRNSDQHIVFNMPLGFSYKATNPFGWPQILFCVYGRNVWATETCLGYARIHIPMFGSENMTTEIPILLPRYTNLVSEIMGWLTKKGAELKIPKLLTFGSKARGLRTSSYGQLTVRMSTMSRSTNKMGLEWGRMPASNE